MKKYVEDLYTIKTFHVVTRLRKLSRYYRNADRTFYRKASPAFKTRLHKVKLIPKPGYQYSLFEL